MWHLEAFDKKTVQLARDYVLPFTRTIHLWHDL